MGSTDAKYGTRAIAASENSRSGQITTTTAPKRNVGGVKPPVLSGNLPVLTTQR